MGGAVLVVRGAWVGISLFAGPSFDGVIWRDGRCRVIFPHLLPTTSECVETIVVSSRVTLAEGL